MLEGLPLRTGGGGGSGDGNTGTSDADAQAERAGKDGGGGGGGKALPPPGGEAEGGADKREPDTADPEADGADNPFRMGDDEDFADYAQEMREAMSDEDLDAQTLTEMRDAFAEAMIRQPDWFYHAQGIERDDLADLKPVEDPVAAEGTRATFAEHGLLPTETAPGMAYVIDENGTVYHRDPDLSDTRLTGDIYTLRDLTNRADAVTTRGHVEDGNFGEALARRAAPKAPTGTEHPFKLTLPGRQSLGYARLRYTEWSRCRAGEHPDGFPIRSTGPS